MATNSEVFLLTFVNGASRWAFEREEDILPSIETSYSTLDHSISRPDRGVYVVKFTVEDIVKSDVYIVLRVPLLQAPTHL